MARGRKRAAENDAETEPTGLAGSRLSASPALENSEAPVRQRRQGKRAKRRLEEADNEAAQIEDPAQEDDRLQQAEQNDAEVLLCC